MTAIVAVLAMIIASASAAPTFKFFASVGGPQNAASYSGYTANAISTILATDTLPTGQRTGPTDARLIQHIVPQYLMTTVSLPFYWDSFSPAAPWSNERGGTIWGWEEITASPGETIALADVSGVITSSDSGNIVGKTYSFGSVNYSTTALGINLDGSQITSGPANQQVTGRIIVGIGYKSFPVSTSSDVQGVKNWIYSFTKWGITNVVTAKGASATFVLTTIPPLTGFTAGGNFKVTAAPSDDPKSYALQSSTNLATGVWIPAGTIQAGHTNDFGSFILPQFFVRIAP